MTDWFTADLHFDHEMILEYCDRPFKNVAKMNHHLIKNINNRVKPDERLFILGDLGLHGPARKGVLEQLIRKIKCKRKILIVGNHDKLKPMDYVDIGFESAHTSLYLHQYDLHLIHDPSVCGIDAFKHYRWACGHVHKFFLKQKNTINVGVDVWNYRPASIDEILQMIKQEGNL